MSLRVRFAGIGFGALVILCAAVLYWAMATEVRVPLLWPAGATLMCAADFCRRVRARRAEAREAKALLTSVEHSAQDGPTVRQILSRPTSLRIGDAERDVVMDALHTHFSLGRLTQAEHAERLEAALAAKTGGDLAALVADLPSEVTG